jgi:hypothetical protein
MNTEHSDLVAWCHRQRDEARRQIDLFGAGGAKAMLQMPDGTTQDITSGVLQHQTENIAVFERLISALRA